MNYPEPVIPLKNAEKLASDLSQHLSTEAYNFVASYGKDNTSLLDDSINRALMQTIGEETKKAVMAVLCKDCPFP